MKSWAFEFNLRRPHKTIGQQANVLEEKDSRSGVSNYPNPNPNPNHAYMSRKEEEYSCIPYNYQQKQAQQQTNQAAMMGGMDAGYVSYNSHQQQQQARYGNNHAMKGGIRDGYYSTQVLPYQAHSMMSKEECCPPSLAGAGGGGGNYQAYHINHAAYQVHQAQPSHDMSGKGGLYSSYGNGTSQIPQYPNMVRKLDPCSYVSKDGMNSKGYHHEEYGCYSNQNMMFQSHGMEREEDFYAGKASNVTGYY